MPIMRKTVQIDADGKFRIPGNIARAAGIQERDWLEVRLTGGAQAPYLLIKRRPAGQRPARRG